MRVCAFTCVWVQHATPVTVVSAFITNLTFCRRGCQRLSDWNVFSCVLKASVTVCTCSADPTSVPQQRAESIPGLLTQTEPAALTRRSLFQAAWGGGCLLSNTHKHLLSGVERSVVRVCVCVCGARLCGCVVVLLTLRSFPGLTRCCGTRTRSSEFHYSAPFSSTDTRYQPHRTLESFPERTGGARPFSHNVAATICCSTGSV